MPVFWKKTCFKLTRKIESSTVIPGRYSVAAYPNAEIKISGCPLGLLAITQRAGLKSQVMPEFKKMDLQALQILTVLALQNISFPKNIDNTHCFYSCFYKVIMVISKIDYFPQK